MIDARINNYEAMFVLSQAVAADLNGAVSHIRQIIEKAGGTILAMRKWDERRLAYEIDKQKRAYYLLVFFQAPGPRVTEIERSCNLSEQIMRTLILTAEHLSVEDMKSADAPKELEMEAKLRSSQPAPIAVTPIPVVVDSADGEDE